MENNKYNYINEFLEGVTDGYISQLELYSRIQDITDNFNKTKLKILIADIDSKIVEIGHFIEIDSIGIDKPQEDSEIKKLKLSIRFLKDAISYINILTEPTEGDLQPAQQMQHTQEETKNYPDILTSEKAFKVIDHYCKTYNSKPQYDLGCLYHMSIKKNFWKTRPTKSIYIDMLVEWGYLTTEEFDQFTDMVRNPIPIESKSLMSGRDKNFKNSYELYF
tara:strand:+ start:4175 stop:4834 length:660 start_codon:yes stop_codon:yes gene_type:complete